MENRAKFDKHLKDIYYARVAQEYRAHSYVPEKYVHIAPSEDAYEEVALYGVFGEAVEKPDIIKVEQEKKYCDDCKEVITAKSELALPKADIGLNATILICYLWVSLG